tara:strand:- start:39 stop:209 length:171 start_codon:yes stop_codon:yes gene_type:complete
MDKVRTQNIKKKKLFWCKRNRVFVEDKNVVINYNAVSHKTEESNEEKSNEKECKKN